MKADFAGEPKTAVDKAIEARLGIWGDQLRARQAIPWAMVGLDVGRNVVVLTMSDVPLGDLAELLRSAHVAVRAGRIVNMVVSTEDCES